MSDGTQGRTRRILVLRHVENDGMGRIAPALKLRKLDADVVSLVGHANLSLNLNHYRAVMVLGGPMSANGKSEWFVRELYLIEQALRFRIPLMGICLGAQMIAKVLGKRVERAEIKEIGWCKISPTPEARADPLMGGLEPDTEVFQWHYDTYELPDGAVRLAYSDRCREQAFRWGDRVWGMQFHLEVSPEGIERWQEEDRRSGEREMEADVDPWLNDRELGAFAAAVFGGFLDVASEA